MTPPVSKILSESISPSSPHSSNMAWNQFIRTDITNQQRADLRTQAFVIKTGTKEHVIKLRLDKGLIQTQLVSVWKSQGHLAWSVFISRIFK